MATSFSCDGCGCAVAEPAKVGQVVQRDYCEACKLEAEAFVEAEAKLRKQTHDGFIAKRAKLIAAMSKNDFKLPDVP